MKLRRYFVSNSSSSSFIVAVNENKISNFKSVDAILTYMIENMFSEYPCGVISPGSLKSDIAEIMFCEVNEVDTDKEASELYKRCEEHINNGYTLHDIRSVDSYTELYKLLIGLPSGDNQSLIKLLYKEPY